MPGKMILNFKDYGGERSSVSFHVTEPTGATYDAISAQIDTLQTRVEALTLGQTQTLKFQARNDLISSAKATDPEAARELKWLCTYVDDVTGTEYQFEMPCVDVVQDPPLHDATKEKNAILTHTAWVNFIASFEGLALSPVGNAVSFVSARRVGRNL